jgi:hypothetical protein
MNGEFKALLSGFTGFIVATATVVLVRGERDGTIDAVSIGSVWDSFELVGTHVSIHFWCIDTQQSHSISRPVLVADVDCVTIDNLGYCHSHGGVLARR